MECNSAFGQIMSRQFCECTATMSMPRTPFHNTAKSLGRNIDFADLEYDIAWTGPSYAVFICVRDGSVLGHFMQWGAHARLFSDSRCLYIYLIKHFATSPPMSSSPTCWPAVDHVMHLV